MLIGFLGRARSGKDTCIEALVREFGGQRAGFADQVKVLVQRMFDLPDDPFEGDKGKATRYHWQHMPENGGRAGVVTVRELLQWFGTDICRRIDPLIWIRAFTRIWGKTMQHVYVADVRFQNEVNYILGNGGFVIKLLRADADTPAEVAAHESESGIDSIVPSFAAQERFLTFDNRTMSLAEQDAAIVKFVRERIAVIEGVWP